MSIIVPIKEIDVQDFSDFCKKFKIKSKLLHSKNRFDEELIISELSKVKNQKWIINFIENNNDGYFKLQQIQ